MHAILTLNAGSSSIKFAVYADAVDPEALATGQIDGLGPDATLILKSGEMRHATPLGPTDHDSGVPAILHALAPVLNGRRLAGVGHRIVHGGPDRTAPARLTPDLLQELSTFEPLAPLHQPHNLAAVRAAVAAFPEALQIGCFDTAFHRGHPFVADTYGLPRKYYEAGVRRYGFHGLSYEFISEELSRRAPELARGRVVVAHLGNGASLCALEAGRSIASTMGFSPLDGLPMGTRPGQLDPGVLLYLLDHGLSQRDLTALLYKDSGLKGMSGLSHDMRHLLASDAPKAAEALDYYVHRIRREIAALVADLGGLDGIVFTGGVGENAPEIRHRILEGLTWLGVAPEADVDAPLPRGCVPALVIPTDEERVISRAVSKALSA